MKIGKHVIKFPLSNLERGPGGEVAKRKKRRLRPSDIIFWALIILLLIPSTRSVILGGVAKVRVAIFTPSLKAVDGPLIQDGDWAWGLTSLDGQTRTLADFRGQVVLVNSWATWCPPCRAEMPSLEKLYQEYGDKVSMILVTQEEAAVVKEYIDKKGFSFPVYISRGGYPQAFSSKSIPTTFIVNKKGQVVFQRSGAFDWNNNKVRLFLGKLLNE